MLTNVNIEGNINSVDTEEQSYLGQHCLTTRLLKNLSRRQKQIAFVVIVALGVGLVTVFKVQYFKG